MGDGEFKETVQTESGLARRMATATDAVEVDELGIWMLAENRYAAELGVKFPGLVRVEARNPYFITEDPLIGDPIRGDRWHFDAIKEGEYEPMQLAVEMDISGDKGEQNRLTLTAYRQKFGPHPGDQDRRRGIKMALNYEVKNGRMELADAVIHFNYGVDIWQYDSVIVFGPDGLGIGVMSENNYYREMKDRRSGGLKFSGEDRRGAVRLAAAEKLVGRPVDGLQIDLRRTFEYVMNTDKEKIKMIDMGDGVIEARPPLWLK